MTKAELERWVRYEWGAPFWLSEMRMLCARADRLDRRNRTNPAPEVGSDGR